MPTRTLPVLLACVLASTVAVAQPAPSAPVPAATKPAATPVRKPSPRVEQRIAALRKKLTITPAQTPAFNDFAQVMRDNSEKMGDRIDTARKTQATDTAIDQMQAYASIAQQHVEDIQRLVPAFSRLYDQLSPAQKKLADDSFRDFSNQGLRTRG